MNESVDVVVIGAGPAGLAAGACLRKAGLTFIILEQEQQAGSSWRRHYERLHLHTVKQFSSLPHLPFPAHYPRYVPRDLIVAYLNDYAAHFDLTPRFGERVGAVRRDTDGWRIESTTSSVNARDVIVASGYNAEPVSPPVPGLETFNGTVMHSAAYANAQPFAGRSVLVVGMGNTGAEIALDLCEGGARVTISVRGPVHIAPRDLFGIPIQIVAMLATSVLPARVNDAIFPVVLDLALGDLSKHGIRRPREGILHRVASAAKIPVLDVGTVRKISEGALKVVPKIAGVTPDGATFADGGKFQFDAIILATGYRPNYGAFLDEQAHGDPTLHFIGFNTVVTGLLREIGKEAIRTVDAIAQRRTRCRRA